jgi:hypothetical protein
MLIDGRLPDGILPSNTVAAIGEVSSPVSISLESGDLVLTESGYLRVSDGTDYPTAAVTILSTGDVTLSGRIASPTNFQLAAADSVLLDGSIHAGESIRITAGQGSQNQGDITGTFFADLVTAGDDRRIELTAGTAGGSITLVDSDLLSDYVSLHAVSGAVSHGPGGLIDAATLHMLSSAGVSARARSGNVTAIVSTVGDIQINNLQGMRLIADTADGALNVSAAGTIYADVVAVRGGTLSNALRVSALSAASGTLSDIVLGEVVTSPGASILLRATGSVIGLDDVVVDPNGLEADTLTIMAQSVPNLVLRVREADITVLGPGDMQITQLGTQPLTLSVSLQNGGLTVEHLLGDLTLRRALLHTDTDANDLSITVGGNLLLGKIRAGQYFATAADIPATATGAAPGIHSLGDVTLLSEGYIRTIDPNDNTVDIIADELVIRGFRCWTAADLRSVAGCDHHSRFDRT